MRDWFLKLRLKLLYSVLHAIEIKPFLKIDPNQYCPACGNTQKKILNAMVKEPGDDGSKIAVVIACPGCNYRWAETSVTKIANHMYEEDKDEAETNLREMKADKRTRMVRTQVKVNGSVLP